MPAGRLAGVDFGSRRIGLAWSDPEGLFASPLTTVPGAPSLDECAAAVVQAVADCDIAGFVVGLPLYMDGEEGPQAAISRRFAESLATLSLRPVCLWDERLSSCAAEAAMRSADLTRSQRKGRIDRVAAQVILQTFIERYPRPRT